MDGERKINLSEGVPLNTPGAANIFLNTGNDTKVSSPNGTVIHLKADNNSPADVGVHINTTFSIASSKKIKILFVLNFLLSVICMVTSCSVAFYYWNEMSLMHRQLDAIKEQLLIQSLKESTFGQDRAQAKPLVSFQRPRQIDRESKIENSDDLNTRRYGDDAVPERKLDMPVVPQQENTLIAHFNGAIKEVNLGMNGAIGPWLRDADISGKDSASRIELHGDYVKMNESGVYFIYAQVVYLSQAPNCFFIWARPSQPEGLPNPRPRLLSTCSTGDDSSKRSLQKSQISCSTHTVARLNVGETITLTQREQNRTVWLKPGYSHFGFIKLGSL